jgi:hypothetical protein
MEPFFVTHVFPEFDSPFPFLRARVRAKALPIQVLKFPPHPLIDLSFRLATLQGSLAILTLLVKR